MGLKRAWDWRKDGKRWGKDGREAYPGLLVSNYDLIPCMQMSFRKGEIWAVLIFVKHIISVYFNNKLIYNFCFVFLYVFIKYEER